MGNRGAKWKRYLRNRQKKAEKQRRIYKKWRKQRNRDNNKASERLPKEIKKNIQHSQRRHLPTPIKAPAKFSLIHHPDDVLAFFQLAKKYIDKKVEVMLDFSTIEMVTSDAIALLLAKVSNPRYTNGVRVYGNRPENSTLDEIFKASGFYKIVGMDKTVSEYGVIHTKRNTIVDREIAVEARILAAKKTYNCDTKLKPLYRTLIECMANTKKHAKGKSVQDETWWLAVFNNNETKVTSFSFIDTGIGIFKSAKIQAFTRFAVKLGLKSNIEILKDLLAGKIQSSTGLRHRGKGIPKIYNDFKDSHLHKLHIISNDVYANLHDGIFLELKHPLNGTFYYWEILPPLNDNHGSDNRNLNNS